MKQFLYPVTISSIPMGISNDFYLIADYIDDMIDGERVITVKRIRYYEDNVSEPTDLHKYMAYELDWEQNFGQLENYILDYTERDDFKKTVDDLRYNARQRV